MDPGNLGDMLKHLEKQNELLKKASESVIQELSNLQGEEEMMMRKYYTIMSEHGKVKKKLFNLQFGELIQIRKMLEKTK